MERPQESREAGPESTQEALKALDAASHAFEQAVQTCGFKITGSISSNKCELYVNQPDEKSGRPTTYDISSSDAGGVTVQRGARFQHRLLTFHRVYPAGTFPNTPSSTQERLFGKSNDGQDMPDQVSFDRSNVANIFMLHGNRVLGTQPNGDVEVEQKVTKATGIVQKVRGGLAALIPGMTRRPAGQAQETVTIPHTEVIEDLQSMTVCLQQATDLLMRKS